MDEKMIFCDLSTFKVAFKAMCTSVTAVMVVYWIVKYLKDEDISVVEYKLAINMTTAFQPEFTICFENPFIEEKLSDIDPDVSPRKYFQYLKGEIPGDATYNSIDYDNVTIQLFKHLDHVIIFGQFPDGQKYKNCTNIDKCPFIVIKNNLNTFVEYSVFYKCFGVRPSDSYGSKITGIRMAFSQELRPLVGRLGNIFMGFNFPQQLFQDYTSGQYWNKLNVTGYAEWFKITTVELLKRRDKSSQRCFSEWKEHDDWILNKHVKNIGCRAPYMKLHENFKTCDTQEKMNESVMD